MHGLGGGTWVCGVAWVRGVTWVHWGAQVRGQAGCGLGLWWVRSVTGRAHKPRSADNLEPLPPRLQDSEARLPPARPTCLSGTAAPPLP